MEGLNKMVQRAPRLLIIVILIVTAFFAYFVPRVGMTTDVKDFFPAEHADVKTYNEIEEKFGGAEYIMVAVEALDVFQYETLVKIRDITSALEQIDGVGQVRSLTSVDDVRGSPWGIEMTPLIGEIPKGKEELQKLRKDVLADPMYAGSMAAVNGDAALIVVEVKPSADPVATAAAVQEVVQANAFGEELHVTGTPVLNQVLADSMRADLAKLFPLVLLLIAAVLFLHFRNIRGVLFPFITVLISVIWTLGLMGILGRQLSPLNAVMPVILVSLGSAYGIYILAGFNEEMQEGVDSKQAVAGTIVTVGRAVLMAGATTFAGFASNVTSSITLMRDFGLFTAFGIFTSLLISLLLIPALLLVAGTGKPKPGLGKKKVGLLKQGLGFLADFVVEKSLLVVMIGFLIVLAAASGLPRLKTDSNFFNFFDDGSKPKIAYELVADKFSGSQSIEVVLKGDLRDPAVLRAMGNFQTDLERTGLVGTPTSIVNLLERVNSALNEGDPAFAVLPGSRELTAQYLLLLEMNDEQGMLSRFLTLDYSEARIQALVKDADSKSTTALFATADQLIQKHFDPLDVSVTKTGIIVLMNSLADLIIEGQIYSLIFSVISVFIIVRLLLKSWEGSVLSILLIFLTTLINFGLMGWLGISLDIVTVLISSIGIGVGIDYSIHVYSRYGRERAASKTLKQALKAAITQTGTAIAANAGAVVAGFLILIFSSFPPLRYFGSLVTVTMLAAAGGALTLLPALINLKAVFCARGKNLSEVYHEKN